MARNTGGSRSQGGPIGAPPEPPAGEPIRELYPTMDARFVLVEIGKLMSQTEANTKAVDKLSEKISSLDGSFKTAKTIGRVIIAALVIVGGGIWWLAGALWPFRDKLWEIITHH